MTDVSFQKSAVERNCVHLHLEMRFRLYRFPENLD